MQFLSSDHVARELGHLEMHQEWPLVSLCFTHQNILIDWTLRTSFQFCKSRDGEVGYILEEREGRLPRGSKCLKGGPVL